MKVLVFVLVLLGVVRRSASWLSVRAKHAESTKMTHFGLSAHKEEENGADQLSCASSRREFLSWGAATSAYASILGLVEPAHGLQGPPPRPVASPYPATPSSSFDPSIPFSSVRKYKTIQLSNGLKVLLVSDKRASRAMAALSVQNAGQFSDPPDLPGLAHLCEHTVLSYNSRSKFRKSADFEDWLAEQEGASNAFTAYEQVCFHFTCPFAAFGEGLERFASLFIEDDVVRVCQQTDKIKREIRRVDSELDFEAKHDYYLTKSFCTLEHPYARFSAGNLETLERIPKENGVDVASRLIEFFRRYYLPSQAVLVVLGPQDLFALERFVAPFAATLSTRRPSNKSESVPYYKTYPGGFLQGNRLKHLVLYHKGDATEEKLTFEWPLDLDYKDRGRFFATATQIAFIMSQILGRRGPGSLYLFLKRRGWIVQGANSIPRVVVPLDVSGFQIIRLEIPLTLEGFLNRSAIVAAVYDVIQSLGSRGTLSRALVSQYTTIAKLQGYVLAPRPPDAVELAVDAQFYGLQGQVGVSSGRWYRFPSPEDRGSIDSLQRAATEAFQSFSDPENAIIIATAGSKTMSRSGLFDDALPPLSSPRWLTEPVSGARFLFEDMRKLPSRLEEIVLSKLIDDVELQTPVLNPLIPSSIRPARRTSSFSFQRQPNADENLLFSEAVEGDSVLLRRAREDNTRFDDWLVLNPSPFDPGLPLPRTSPEPSCRCAFVLQLLSSRPARANVRQAAAGELWKRSFEYAVSDLAELGLPGGLAYDMSFNKFGMRLCFLGTSQSISSYARRLCRRLVDHHFRLLDGPEVLPPSVTRTAIATANRAAGLSQQRRRRIISNLRSASTADVAAEGIAFLRSCNGAVCFAEGDLLRKEVEALLAEVRDIFSDVTGPSGRTMVALPDVDELVYKADWKPRAASPCAVPGVILLNDACGRVPR